MVVLQSVGLVDHQAGPRDGAQDGLVYSDQLVGRQQHVELDGGVFLRVDGGRNVNKMYLFRLRLFTLLGIGIEEPEKP